MQRRHPSRARGKRVLLTVAFVSVIAGVSMILAKTGGMQALIVHEQRLRTWINVHPLSSFGLGLAVYGAVSLIPGTTGKAIAAGWLYGFWKGVLVVEVGLSAAALLAFLFSRYVLRELVRSPYAVFLDRLDQNLLRHPGLYVLTLRLAHVPYTVLNYALGATAIPLRTFVWTTAGGLLPGTLAFVFAGARLPTLSQLADEGAWSLLEPWLLGVLGLSAVAVPLVNMALGWWKRRSASAARRLQETDDPDG